MLSASFKEFEEIIISKKNAIESLLTGVLFHGFYLGGVFFSISRGMPTSIAALIVTLQPILTNILAGPLLNEKISWRQWLGIFLGFICAAQPVTTILFSGNFFLDLRISYCTFFSAFFSYCTRINYSIICIIILFCE